MAATQAATWTRPTGQTFTEGQVVILQVDDGEYALPIGQVQEIVRVPAITTIPLAEAGVEGVINLRGRVLPVISLGNRLGLTPVSVSPSARVVVAEHHDGGAGLLVDAVHEVLTVPADAVEPPSAIVTEDRAPAVRGVAKLGERLVLLLDLDTVLRLAATPESNAELPA
jgi:purine-binding chemotaxis protein CheW